MIKFSVVIPCFNDSAYLTRSVQSVCAQTYESLELIVVDDGSTDQTREVCEELKRSTTIPFRYLYQPNGGVSSARNRGIETAESPYLVSSMRTMS